MIRLQLCILPEKPGIEAGNPGAASGKKFETYQSEGALHLGANYRSPLVYRKRRARECPAFFYAHRQIRRNSKGLWRRTRRPRWFPATLWFDLKHGLPCRNATFRHGTPFQTDQNSRSLWFTGGRWLTGRFATGARCGQLSNCVRMFPVPVCFNLLQPRSERS